MKYRTRTEFQEKSDSAYTYALRHGFLDDICGHMEVIGNMQRRCIYAFEFEDNHVYVGLTCNIRRREHSHLTEKKSAVYKHIASSGLSPQLIIVHDYTSKEAACILENETINIYRKNGWHILNRVKGGALGALPKKWTKDRCLSVLKECDSLSEFKGCFPGAYNSCLANEWMDEVYQIYPETYTEDEIRREAAKYQYREDFWRYSRDAYNSAFKQRLLGKICSELDLKWKERTEDSLEINRVISEIEFDELRDIAKKYQTKKSFKKGDRTAYNKACRLHLLQAVCTHMTVAKKWTREECKTIAQKYAQRNDFRKNESRAYSAACQHGWLEEVCSHMPKPVPLKMWTKEECQAIALKYSHRSEFRTSDSRAYDISRKHGWLDEICSHMPLPDPAKVQTKISSESDHQKTWTKEECLAIALKYDHRSEFRKSDSRAYEISRRHGWLDEICSHMPLPELPMRWTKEECARIAKTYCRRSEFRKSNLKAYEAARTHNWLDEICSHMSGTKHKKRFYWTKEKCQGKALLYQHRVDFKNGDGSAYSTAVRCGWLDEICSHMTKPSPKVRWTKEECHKVALKYKTASEFRKQERSVYATALQKGWLEDICSHLIFTSRKGLGRKFKK